MKKIVSFFMFVTFLVSVTFVSTAQNSPEIKSTGKFGNIIVPSRDGELDCPPNSLFSQPPVNPDNAYFSDTESSYFNQNIFEDFSGVASPIGGITFWGIIFNVDNSSDCYGGGSVDFTINFYQDNAGAVGTLDQSFNVTLTPTVTGSVLANASLLKFETVLPSAVSLANGWVSVVRLNPGPDNCMFGWANTFNGDNLMGFNSFGGTIFYQGTDVAVCLSSELVPTVIPISNWALFIGLALILTFSIIRFRRTF